MQRTAADDRPTRAEWRAFAAQGLQAAGLGALGAGILFFIAANWQAWDLLGRFALLQAGLLICVAAALWRAPPHPIGQSALLLATLVGAGALALFGQSYQTGADVHELFLTWALLTLPFALAAISGAVWALWWTVLNVGLALMCGVLGLDHVIWRLFDGWGWHRATLLMLPCLVNLLAAGVFLALRATRFAAASPLWLARYLAALGIAYGSAASLPLSGRGSAALAVYAVLSVAIAAGTWLRRRDVFPLTLLAGSWITISTAWLIHSMRFSDIGELFLVALWLIGSSTGAGMLLMRWLRAWRADTTAGAAS
ncbi:MAG: DUF2157 domain-containing protein [Burkholderiales bacterium]